MSAAGGDAPLPPRAGPVVDADGHVVEPAAAWGGLPDRVRPHINADSAGYEHVVVGETEILAVPLGTLARPGSTFDDPSAFRPLAEAQPGGSDPHARLADMDAEGIDQSVLYPTIGLYFSAVEDRSAAVALAAAYNDWLAGYCAADRRRLFGAAMLPLQDPEAAALELRRAVTELGFVAGFVRPNPCLGRSLCDPAYEPVWDAAEELDVPIGIHEGSSVIVPTLGSDRPFNPLVLHAVSHPFEEMLACAQLIAFGVLERHPALRVVFLESSGGWAPFWLERLDEQAESFGGFCPDHGAAPLGVLRPAVRHQLRGRRAHAARAGALRRPGPHRVGQRLPAPRRHLPRRGRRPAGHRRPLPHRHAGQGARAQRPQPLPPPVPPPGGPAALVDDYFAAVTAQDPDARAPALRARRRPSTSTATAAEGTTTSCATTPSTPSPSRTSAPTPGPCQVDGTTVHGRHRRPPRRAPTARCATSSRPTGHASPRCASAASPTCCAMPATRSSQRDAVDALSRRDAVTR